MFELGHVEILGKAFELGHYRSSKKATYSHWSEKCAFEGGKRRCLGNFCDKFATAAGNYPSFLQYIPSRRCQYTPRRAFFGARGMSLAACRQGAPCKNLPF